MNKITTLLFDFDGTLLDTDMLVIRSYLHVFDKYRPDYKLTLKELSSFLGPKLKDVFPKYFKEDFNELLSAYHKYSYSNITRFAYVFDGVYNSLELLKNKGYKLGIVTNRFKDSLFEVIKPFDLKKYFDCFIALDDVKYSKPNKEAIDKALILLNSKKEETIFIGDTESDIMAGINADVKTALVGWSHFKGNKQINADYILNSFDSLFEDLKLEVNN